MDDKAEIPVIPALSLMSRDGTLLKDALLTNGFFTPIGESSVRVEKRQGVLWTEQTHGATGKGLYIDPISYYSVEDLHVYSGPPGSRVLLTPDNPSGFGQCYFASTGTLTNPTWVAWHGGTNVVRSHDRVEADNIVDQTVPGVVGSLQPGIAYLDSTFYVVDSSGNVFGSPLGDPSTPWDPLNVIVAQNEADKAVGIARHLNYIVVFGQRTITRFYDAGNSPGSPLSQVIGAFRHVGCIDGRSIVRIGEMVFWVGTDQFGYRRVYTFNGYEPQEISTPDVCRVLSGATGIAIAYAQTDRSYYMVQIPTGYLMFDTVSKFWSFWNFSKQLTTSTHTLLQDSRDPSLYTYTGSVNSDFVRINVNSTGNQFIPIQGQSGGVVSLRFPTTSYGASVSAVVTDYAGLYPIVAWSSGTMQAADTALGVPQNPSGSQVFNDTFAYLAGSTNEPVEFRSRSQDTDFGSRIQKSVSYLDIDGDKSGASVFIRVSDNDYTTYSGWRYTAMGATPRLWNFGSFKRRSYEICSLDNFPLRITHLVQKIQG